MSKEKEAATKEEKPPKDWGKLLTLLFMVVNLATLGGGAFLVYSSTLGFHPPVITEKDAEVELKKKQEGQEANPVVYTMDPFVVNLEGQPRRIIRTVLSLEMLDEDGFEEVVRLGAKTRDSIVRLLNGKSYSDVETVQGKLFLKDQIASILNQELKTGVVKDVFFNEFVVQ
jgi:flagellar FliL protein